MISEEDEEGEFPPPVPELEPEQRLPVSPTGYVVLEQELPLGE